MQIKFNSVEHRNFFMECMQESKSHDTYHQAIFYTLGINKDCRSNFNAIFDKETDRIKPDALYEAWQTSGSECVTRLAFNLWNGFVEEGHEKDSTPYDLFACEHAPYFFEAIKLRFPEYCKEYQSKSNDTISR